MRQVLGITPRVGGLAGYAAAAVSLLSVAYWLRDIPLTSSPEFFGYSQILCCLISLTLATNAFVRFRGLRDRLSLMLAAGYILSSGILAASGWAFFRLHSQELAGLTHVPMLWWLNRTILAVVLLAALWVEKHRPTARRPVREIAIVLGAITLCAVVLTALYGLLPTWAVFFPTRTLPRPWHLFLAGVYAFGAAGFRQRLKQEHSRFEEAVFLSALLGAGTHLVASQTELLTNAPFALAQLLEALSYAVALGGLLWENVELFDRVQHLAIHDSLTGLPNYRTLMESLEGELERSKRSGRSFAVLLLDLDDLKLINDRFGHLAGSHAIRRVADVLRVNSRAIDTPARYGGDEFALVLPETTRDAARAVAARVGERLAAESEKPRLSVSIGMAIYPADGSTIEQLLLVADTALYGTKPRRRRTRHPLTVQSRV